MKKTLSGWEDVFSIDDIVRWCGNYDAQWKRDIRNRIKQKEHSSVLDVGAGCCSEYYGFKNDNYEISYTATDITQKYVEYSRNKGIDIVWSDMECMPFDDESFDCCLCTDVMTHQINYRKSIIELLRVAKKEVIITFFKPFLEDAIFGKQVIYRTGEKIQFPPYAHTSGNYGLVEVPTQTGFFSIYEERVLNQDMEPVCIYSFFNRAKLKEFLDTLDVLYTFEKQKENPEKTNLYLEKKKS
tara:strand:+ start:3180 stop:3902 length:723 start_codon:yes stop_codon:yes gene_type:complete